VGDVLLWNVTHRGELSNRQIRILGSPSAQLDQAADGFGAIGVVILAPRINLLGQSRRKTDGADGIDATLFFRATRAFSCLRELTYRKGKPRDSANFSPCSIPSPRRTQIQ